MDNKKSGRSRKEELDMANLQEFFLFPTHCLQKILFSQDGFEYCIKMGIFHHAYKMFQKDDFQVSNKEIMLIIREYKKDKPYFSNLSDDTRIWLGEWSQIAESEIMKWVFDDVPRDIRLFAAIRRSYSLFNLKYSTLSAITVMECMDDHSKLNWKKSLAWSEMSSIFEIRDNAEKSRKNERERILFCLLMGIASIISMRAEWKATNQNLMKARMFGFETVSELDKFMDSKTSPKWLKRLVEKYTTRRVFDGLKREILKRGWCKTIMGTPFRKTIVSIAKFPSEFDDEINEFLFKKYGKNDVHL